MKTKDVFVIREAGDKKYWTRCGVAFLNKDGSLNIRLDLFPNVALQIRDRKPKEARKPRK